MIILENNQAVRSGTFLSYFQTHEFPKPLVLKMWHLVLSITWELVSNATIRARPRPPKSEILESEVQRCVLIAIAFLAILTSVKFWESLLYLIKVRYRMQFEFTLVHVENCEWNSFAAEKVNYLLLLVLLISWPNAVMVELCKTKCKTGKMLNIFGSWFPLNWEQE